MGNLVFAIPAALLGRLAWTSIRTGTEWTRFSQWDAAATNIAISAIMGSAALSLASKAIPWRE